MRSAPRCARAGAWRPQRCTAFATTSSSIRRASCRCRIQRRAICAISALANALIVDPDTLDDVARAVAPQAELDVMLVLRGTRRVQEQIEAAVARSAA